MDNSLRRCLGDPGENSIEAERLYTAGTAPEALRRVLELGFDELAANEIDAQCATWHSANRRVMEKTCKSMRSSSGPEIFWR
jgi:hypothetical protein